MTNNSAITTEASVLSVDRVTSRFAQNRTLNGLGKERSRNFAQWREPGVQPVAHGVIRNRDANLDKAALKPAFKSKFF